MRNCQNQLYRLVDKIVTLSTLLICGLLFSSTPVLANSVNFNLSGDFGGPGFGGTGVEDGSFSGTFTLDLAAPDEEPDPAFGVYSLTDYSFDIFFETGDLADNLSPDDGGTANIIVDPGGTAFGNISLQLEITLDTGVLQVFGVYFDLSSIVSDALPIDLPNATYTGDGLLGFIAGGTVAATFIDSAVITKVPVPPALLLLGSGLVALLRFSRH